MTWAFLGIIASFWQKLLLLLLFIVGPGCHYYQVMYVTATTAVSLVLYWPKHKTSISDKRRKCTALIT
jgi:uncharacterized membrane protein YwaF